MHRIRVFMAAICCMASSIIMMGEILAQSGQEFENNNDEAIVHFVGLLVFDAPTASDSLDYIGENWQPGFAVMALEVLRLTRSNEVVHTLFVLLRRNTGMDIGNSLDSWYQWLWTQPEQKYAAYARFKSLLYRLIDAKFEYYFDDDPNSTIRLDEVVWGGVHQDGIPPLRQPEMIPASSASYLADDNVVFGVEINGDARAYPKRILAWHEMFIDEIGGTEYAGVYCTLCGALILYETRLNGVRHELGTSGFLYRSNKLMYDRASQSLWNTTWGQPVVGPLTGTGIELKRSYVVTTTWGAWRRRHPSTTVLSLETGHQRDYGEGVAYREYFATDDLMFKVPVVDTRLKNKDEVLALTFPELGSEKLAISAEFLSTSPIYHDKVGTLHFVVVTDPSGANRVYESDSIRFKSYDSDSGLVDDDGNSWTLSESSLTDARGRKLQRLPAHRAFWFGWYAANNDTRLVY